MSHRECYCARHGYSCHTELMALSDRLLGTNRVHFNKQLVVRKYLPFYDLVLFADSDVYFKCVVWCPLVSVNACGRPSWWLGLPSKGRMNE